MTAASIRLILASLSVAASCACAAQPADAPRPVAPAPDASYLQRDGSIAIVGNDGMEELVASLNALVVRHHPGLRFATRMEGSSTGMPALTAGATMVAPMTRDLWPADRSAFVQVFGYEPTAVRIGYNGHGPRPPAKTPPAVYVNAANPLAGLPMQDVARIFTEGAAAGDLNTWGQLGLGGAWAERRIHLYGLRDDGGFATGMRMRYFGGRPFSPRYEALSSREALIRAVAADPYGMALVGWMNAAAVSGGVRVLPLASGPGAAFHTPALDDVRRGLYPFSAPVQFYVNKAPGRQLEPLVLEYLRLALSDEGQGLVAAQTASEEGYVPLSPEDLRQERQKLEALGR